MNGKIYNIIIDDDSDGPYHVRMMIGGRGPYHVRAPVAPPPGHSGVAGERQIRRGSSPPWQEIPVGNSRASPPPFGKESRGACGRANSLPLHASLLVRAVVV